MTHDLTPEYVTRLVDINPLNASWYGETCSSCKKTANVCGNYGWFCVCGAFNLQYIYFGPPPHAKPDIGPTGKVIKAGINKSNWWKQEKKFQRRMRINNILWKLHLKE